MRSPCAATPDPLWLDVYRLMDCWAARPSSLWRLLIDEESVQSAPLFSGAPLDYSHWLIRDLIETAWWLATRDHPDYDAHWIRQSRVALERAALRLLR